MDPGAQGVAVEGVEPDAYLAFALTVSLTERCLFFGMGDVHTAHACQQELAADGGHGIEEVDRHAGSGQGLGRHQTGGATPDDSDGRGGRGERHGGIQGTTERPPLYARC